MGNEQKTDWTERFKEMREKQRRAVQTERENKAKAENWVRTCLGPTFDKLASNLREDHGIQGISINPGVLRETLKFEVIDVTTTPLELSYTVCLTVSPQGVTGHTELTLPKRSKYSTEQSEVLKWREAEIINDFLTGYECWEL
jgi:hypothetical protein